MPGERPHGSDLARPRPPHHLLGERTDQIVVAATGRDQRLSLIDRFLTEKEWREVGGSGLKKMPFHELTVAFGMILDGATREQISIMRDTLPRGPWLIFSFLGPRAYVKYAARLHTAHIPALPAAA